MRQFIEIFLIFARVGIFTFGGGFSMLPLLQRDLVEKRGWLTDAEVVDFFSLGQCLPGIIAINTSIFIGHKQGGRAGGIAAALGVLFPSVTVILIIAAFIARFSDIPEVQSAFSGIRVCVCALIVNAVTKLWKSSIVDKASFVVFVAAFAVAVFINFPVALLILAAAIIGISIKALRRHGKK